MPSTILHRLPALKHRLPPGRSTAHSPITDSQYPTLPLATRTPPFYAWRGPAVFSFADRSSPDVAGPPVTSPRGRQARLRAEHAYLYPGLEPVVWMPVETLIHRVVTLLYGDPGKSGVITGERLLRGDHFEFRGQSSRPTGWPSALSRMSDAAAKPRGSDESDSQG